MEKRREFVVSMPVEEGDSEAAGYLADHVVYGSGLDSSQVRVRPLDGGDWVTSCFRSGREAT